MGSWRDARRENVCDLVIEFTNIVSERLWEVHLEDPVELSLSLWARRMGGLSACIDSTCKDDSLSE